MSNFNAFDIIVDILENLGYRQYLTNGWSHSSLNPKEYQIFNSHIRFRVPYYSENYRRYCILRVNGQQVHIHGSQVNCLFIDLAHPRSLDLLRDAIISAEKPNGNSNQS